jgi:5-methyltetrahydropteroyltriglutamate--homocysteine methyltransferase
MNGMKRSSDRILTTHVGSLPRQPEVVEALVRKEKGESYDREKFDSIVRSGVADIVARQAAIGLDVVSDGETGKIGYSTYVRERLSGFGGEYTPKPNRDLADHPEFRRRMSLYLGAQPFRRVCCIGPVALRDPEAVHTDIANFRAALENASVEEGFLNAASPGVVASFLPNRYYPDHESYVQAVAAAMRHEYEAIASAGLVLQVDCPDLAMSRHTGFQDLSDEEFLRVAALNVEALNAALANVPASQIRVHICWGNYEGPHDHDIALDRIMPLIKKVKAGALVFEAANPRHEHEWTVWRDAKLPDDVVLVPGVLDTSSNYVEHPELIAQRIERYASFAGRERVMAGSDCGFGTFAGYAKVDPDIAVKKLRSLVEGAEIATQRLWH